MGFTKVCAADDVGEGDMAAFFLEGLEVLVLRDGSGTLRAMDGTCPHEEFPLIHGVLDGNVLICANHMWAFDATTGKCISPGSCRLDSYALKVDAGEVFVDVDSSPRDEPS